MNKSYDPKGTTWPLKLKLKRLLWVVVNQTAFRYSPFICYGWRRFLLRCFGATISRSATIARTAEINSPWNLTMDEKSMIANHAWVMCSGPVRIGKQAMVGEYCKVLAGSHNTHSRSYQPVMPGIDIQDDAWVASGAMLVAGGKRDLHIGESAIVAAGAVVFSNVRRMTIVVGNPAEFLSDRVIDEN